MNKSINCVKFLIKILITEEVKKTENNWFLIFDTFIHIRKNNMEVFTPFPPLFCCPFHDLLLL